MRKPIIFMALLGLISAGAMAPPGLAADDIVVAGDYTYAAERSRRWNAQVESFALTDEGANDVLRRSSAGFAYIASGVPPYSLDLIAPVKVPDGATMTDFGCYVRDIDPDDNVTVTVRLRSRQRGLANWGDLDNATCSTSGADTSGLMVLCQVSLGSIEADTLDEYWISVTWQPEVTGDSLRLHTCFVDYLTDKIQP